MGWLIISIIIFVLSTILGVISMDKDWTGLEIFSELAGAFSFFAVLVLTAVIACNKPNAKVFQEQYDNAVTLIQTVQEPSEEIIEKTFAINEKIIEHRVKSHKFMTAGFYSKKTGDLPLLEIPDWWPKPQPVE